MEKHVEKAYKEFEIKNKTANVLNIPAAKLVSLGGFENYIFEFEKNNTIYILHA